MPVICFGLDMHSTPSIQYLQWVCEDLWVLRNGVFDYGSNSK